MDFFIPKDCSIDLATPYWLLVALTLLTVVGIALLAQVVILLLREVEAYLALSPEARAELDTQNRVHALANAEKARKDDLVKQAMYERWSKQQPFPQEGELRPILRSR